MKKQYVIQATFYDGNDEFSMYWRPNRLNPELGTFGQPTHWVCAEEIPREIDRALNFARRLLGGRGFHLGARPHPSNGCWLCDAESSLCEFHDPARSLEVGI